jgi:hypothetical protein
MRLPLLFRRLLLLLGIPPLQSFSQLPDIQPLSLNFGEVLETSPDTLALLLRNPGADSLCIEELWTSAFYGAHPFRVLDAVGCIPPGDSLRLRVLFAPQHNVLHEGELLIRFGEEIGAAHVHLSGQGKYSRLYYASSENQSEEALKLALRTRLGQGFLSLSYNAARDEMFMEVDNEAANGQGAPQNRLTCIYTGVQISGFTSRTAAQNLGFNTEHVFPQSFFSENLPMRADLFHLFPATESSNNIRGNLPFGTVSSPDWQSGGSKRGGGRFEPRNEAKGRIARAMLYFVVRYQNYQSFLNGQEAVLRAWHFAYPPDSLEIARNEAIFLRQGNRNPFIDYPQLAERITSFSNVSSALTDYSLHLADTTALLFSPDASPSLPFHWVIVNAGNQLVRIHDASADTSLLLVPGGIDEILLPGHALSIPLRLQSPFASQFTGEARVLADRQGTDTLTLRVRASSGGLPSAIDPERPALRVYPNPAGDYLRVAGHFEGKPLSLQLTDAQGRALSAPLRLQSGQEASFSLAGIAAGHCWLQVVQGEKSWSYPVELRR